AEAQVAEQGPAPAYVLAAEDWHPGVIGILAPPIAERHPRPAVLISPGGPRPGAGLTIARERIEGFRERFAAHAAEVLTPDDLVPECRIDAVVAGDALTLGLAEELEQMAPFGQGNPAISLMVPAALLADPRAL